MPSSPNGPWRIGSTTSTCPSVARRCGVGHDRQRLDARARGALAATVDQLPAPAPVDLDDDRLVSVRVERVDDGTRRLDRRSSCSLERPPASTATRHAWAHGVVVGACSTKRPDEERDERVRLRLRAADWVLRDDDPVERRIVGVLEHHARAEAGGLERRLGDRDVLRRDVGDGRRRLVPSRRSRVTVEPFEPRSRRSASWPVTIPAA